MPWLVVGGQGSISRLQQRRLHIVMARLMEQGFVIKQELRRLIMNAEEPTPHRNTLYDYNGPDTKTCSRLISLLVENKSARLVKLQYTQQGTLESKEVEVVLRNDLQETPELLQQIAMYDQTLPGALRREGMRRALEAQGIAAAAAARAVAAAAAAATASGQGDGGQDPALHAATAAAVAAAAAAAAAATGSIPVLDGQVRFLPAVSAHVACPALGSPHLSAGGQATRPAQEGQACRCRRCDRCWQRRRGGGGQEEAAAAPAAATAAASAALTRKRQASKDVLQLHRNGYIPALGLRLKVLHQYLCSCVRLSVEPSEDAPAAEQGLEPGAGCQAVQVGAAGSWVSDRPGAKTRLHFVLAGPDSQQRLQQQQQQLLKLADRDSDDAKKGGVFEFRRTARAAADAAAAELTEDAAAAAAAKAATEGSGQSAGDVAPQQDLQQLQQLEQQLGGRLLSVHQMWQNMPLAVALQVAGSSDRIANLLELLGNAQQSPCVGDFQPSEVEAVLGAGPGSGCCLHWPTWPSSSCSRLPRRAATMGRRGASATPLTPRI
ncbi:hypothetical protein COO60DRAFT_1131808 [Scenedesmus sp. NREL 46B-D3]|nr:hypothetical protein COO60DRAFT_1131808 [Scenedesmus sp. NREL 46B-D3]